MAKQKSNPDNPVARAARLQKAYRLADWLEANTPVDGSTVDALEGMSDEWWDAAARHAGVRSPSETTRAMVAGILRTRLEDRDKDPFEGLSQARS